MDSITSSFMRSPEMSTSPAHQHCNSFNRSRSKTCSPNQQHESIIKDGTKKSTWAPHDLYTKTASPAKPSSKRLCPFNYDSPRVSIIPPTNSSSKMMPPPVHLRPKSLRPDELAQIPLLRLPPAYCPDRGTKRQYKDDLSGSKPNP